MPSIPSIRRLPLFAAALLVALFAGWSASAQVLLETVHPVRMKLFLFTDEENSSGNDQLRKEFLRENDLLRLELGLAPDEPIPDGLILALIVDCNGRFANLVVWDEIAGEPVEGVFGIDLVSGAVQENSSGDPVRVEVYGEVEAGPPLSFAAKVALAPLPDDPPICTKNLTTRWMLGALAEDVVIYKGWLKAGNVIDVILSP